MHGTGDDRDPDEYNDYTVYESNRSLRRKIGRPQLTAARIVCSTHQKKVFFGSPDPLLVIEDAAARLTLAELEDTFDASLDSYNRM